MLHQSQNVIEKIQAEFFKRLTIQDPSPSIMSSLLFQLLQTEDDIIDLSLGNFGQKLKNFAQKIDYFHPEIRTIFNGVLTDDQDFSKNCRELLVLTSLAKEKQLNRVLPFLNQAFGQYSFPIIKEIDQPFSPRHHVRLLKTPEQREESRLLKKKQIIDLTSLYRKGEDNWQAQPVNFNKFLRFETAYQEEIVKAERKAKRFLKLGCTSLAEEITRVVDEFKQEMDQPYCGFNRVTMQSAAIILAKSLGYVYQPQTFISFQEEISDKIVVNREFFGTCNFLSLNLNNYFVYEPRVYPLHELIDITPKNVSETITTLETFPELGGKPLFDYFAVIVPSIVFPNYDATFLNQQGLIQTYSSKEEATKEFDKMLIRENILTPIIIGERNKKCYFICYFQ